MISLFAVFNRVCRNRKRFCVSPPLVGVVLAITFLLQPVEVYASSISFSPEVYILPSQDTVFTFENPVLEYNDTIPYLYGQVTIPCSVLFYYGVDYTDTMKTIQGGGILYFNIFQGYLENNTVTFVGATVSNLSAMDGYGNSLPVTYISPLIYSTSMSVVISLNSLYLPYKVGTYYTLSFDVVLDVVANVSNANLAFFRVNSSVTYENLVWLLRDDLSPDNQLDSINDSINAGNAQDKQFHDEDKSSAEQAGSDMSGMTSDLENVKNKWAILWYPIEFTNNVFQAFTGGTSSAAYSARMGNVTGYTYDDDSGLLVPVYSKTRAAPESAASGTVITFPAYTLPVLNVQLWDSYSYDLSELKTQFSVLFDALYVLITILEVGWFVHFLTVKYHEVFG